MVYITTGNKRYRCEAPEEHCVNISPTKRQWVIDFTICDAITPADMDELLNGNDLTFIYVDGLSSKETVLNFSGYVKINSVAIKYNKDLSCTASVQLGKEIMCNVSEI